MNHTGKPTAPESTAPPNSPEAPAPEPRPRWRNLWIGAGIVALLALGVAGYWFFILRGIVYTDDARFGGHLVDLAPEVHGRLEDVLVREGERVRRGQDIFRLDPSASQAEEGRAEGALASARAVFASARARYTKTVNGSRPEEIKAAAATLGRLQTQENLAKLDLGRVEALAQSGAVTQDALDNARSGYESARQSRENAAQNFALLQEGSRSEDIAAAKAEMESAEGGVAAATGALDRCRSDLGKCRVVSPVDGWVVRRWLDPGAMPMPGQPVVSVFDPATLRVDANIEEKYLGEIAIGDSADIAVDAYPDLRLHGKVSDILRATNSQFSLIPSEGVSGTFIKVTQRVPLRIAVTAPAGLFIGPGLSVEVKIRTGTAAQPAP